MFVASVPNVQKCFRYIVTVPPTPLTEEDIWFQIGHVHEQQKDVSLKVGIWLGDSDGLILVR